MTWLVVLIGLGLAGLLVGGLIVRARRARSRDQVLALRAETRAAEREIQRIVRETRRQMIAVVLAARRDDGQP